MGKETSNQSCKDWSKGRARVWTNLLPLVGRPSANLSLDRIQSCDSLQRLTSDGRGVSLLQVVELAPHVRPTGDFLNPAIFFIELVESGIGIGLQRTPKRTQMLLGMFALAIG